MERGTDGAGIRSSERPGAAQAPILFPSRELAVAKLQREGGIDRVEAGDARRSIGEVDLRASSCGVIDERHAQRDRNLLGGHTERKRGGVGWGSANGGPADPKRRAEALQCQCSCPSCWSGRSAHGPLPRGYIFGRFAEPSQAYAVCADLFTTQTRSG